MMELFSADRTETMFVLLVLCYLSIKWQRNLSTSLMYCMDHYACFCFVHAFCSILSFKHWTMFVYWLVHTWRRFNWQWLLLNRGSSLWRLFTWTSRMQQMDGNLLQSLFCLICFMVFLPNPHALLNPFCFHFLKIVFFWILKICWIPLLGYDLLNPNLH